MKLLWFMNDVLVIKSSRLGDRGAFDSRHSQYFERGLMTEFLAYRLTSTIRDNIQVYNLPKFDGHHKRAQPKVLQDHIAEIEVFSRKCHELVVVKLLKLFAIILELPDEDQLVKDHVYDVKGEDHLRYMHYKARSPEENEAVGELYTPGHTVS